MKVEDFAAWLSAISGMSEDQRREAMVALEKASVVGGAAAAPAKKGGKRGRHEDALGTTASARGGSGVSPLRGPRNRRLGPLAWAFAVSLHRCGRTFNTLTRTPMAHLRKRTAGSITRAR